MQKLRETLVVKKLQGHRTHKTDTLGMGRGGAGKAQSSKALEAT